MAQDTGAAKDTRAAEPTETAPATGAAGTVPTRETEQESAREVDPATADIVRRLRSVEGHVRGVGRMVEEDAYCMDVLNQVLAVQRALKKVSGLLLDRHLHHCVTRAIRGEDPEERERVIEEILEAFHASGRS